jgi:hypothetical protein
LRGRYGTTRDEITGKKLDLLNEFMRFAFETPDILEQIPPGTGLIILPENAPRAGQSESGNATGA